MRLVCGVGVYNTGKYVCSSYGKITREYRTWSAMLERCYSKTSEYPSYHDCIVDQRFHDFQEFMLWAESQVGFIEKEYHLDKDIILKRNKIYSPETCCFVPREVNNIFIKRQSNRGGCVIGVSYNKRSNKFIARCSDGVNYIWLGSYVYEKDAFLAYKCFKENYCRKMAEKYKDKIDIRVYNALINYQVEIID